MSTARSVEESTTPLKEDSRWGSIREVVNAPLIDVAPDSWWISILFFYVTMLLWIVSTVPAICCSCLFCAYLIGQCDCGCAIMFSTLGSVQRGRPLWLAPNMYRGWLSILWAFLLNGATRLRLFKWEWKAFGSGQYWYHGEGVWCWSYADVRKILQGVQERHSAFGCVRAPIPDMFATNNLVFLPNTGPESEWKYVRFALHQTILADAEKRMKLLKTKLSEEWLQPKMSDLNDATFLQGLVAKSCFWVYFNVWLDDAGTEVIARWNTAAKMCIFPRLVQRIAFNLFISRMKALREETVGLIEKHELQKLFYDMNDSLPAQYRRTPVVKLCDEIMFVLCFAGVNGATAGASTCASFLQCKKPAESDADNIDLSNYPSPADMEAIYKKNSMRYIKEALRLDPPVTSATTSLAKDETVSLAGSSRFMEKGTLNQYVLSMANRDETEFANPSLFNPERQDLDKAVTWNGSFGVESRAQDEQTYPRICPGRYISLAIISAILDLAVGNENSSETMSLAQPGCLGCV
eukprot:TRINITY_DN103047_c0_g1_i1.p1 TRINITY_DN103047_c0_g1~~TRINITY_DN103047_c0_g1_i1.p1  ORF type:complete len:521 (+),score=83.04 TRINITY_DN103047_c0_g1_i1:77-1639(+)